jgi:hypothetical protein
MSAVFTKKWKSIFLEQVLYHKGKSILICELNESNHNAVVYGCLAVYP